MIAVTDGFDVFGIGDTINETLRSAKECCEIVIDEMDLKVVDDVPRCGSGYYIINISDRMYDYISKEELPCSLMRDTHYDIDNGCHDLDDGFYDYEVVNMYAVCDSIAIYGIGDSKEEAVADACITLGNNSIFADDVPEVDEIRCDTGLYCVKISKDIYDYILNHGGNVSVCKDCVFNSKRGCYELGEMESD